MSVHDYLRRVLADNTVSPTAVTAAAEQLMPTIRRWGNAYLLDVQPSGSFAKGTAVLTGTDIDLFISLSPDTGETYSQIHQTLLAALNEDGFTGRPQNVSIGVNVGYYDVDLVPGRRPDLRSHDHHIFRRRSSSWTKTNVARQINAVVNSGRDEEIRLTKIWRNRNGLDFPSCYLELAIIEALRGRRHGELEENILATLQFLAVDLLATRIVDPGNPSNIISDELTQTQRQSIARAAEAALASTWEQVLG